MFVIVLVARKWLIFRPALHLKVGDMCARAAAAASSPQHRRTSSTPARWCLSFRWRMPKGGRPANSSSHLCTCSNGRPNSRTDSAQCSSKHGIHFLLPGCSISISNRTSTRLPPNRSAGCSATFPSLCRITHHLEEIVRVERRLYNGPSVAQPILVVRHFELATSPLRDNLGEPFVQRPVRKQFLQ